MALCTEGRRVGSGGRPFRVRGRKRGEITQIAPEPFDGVSPATGPEDRMLSLGVCEDDHLTNEYAPGAGACHRAFQLPRPGNCG